jgi:hypothetical protein
LFDLKLHDLEPKMAAYQTDDVFKELAVSDSKGRLRQFLGEHLDEKPKIKLEECYEGKTSNVGYLSASIRHIFVHGQMTARSKGISPSQVYRLCESRTSCSISWIRSLAVPSTPTARKSG